MNVRIKEFHMGGRNYIYQVIVDNEVYLNLFLNNGYSLTYSQQADMAEYFREGIEAFFPSSLRKYE